MGNKNGPLFGTGKYIKALKIRALKHVLKSRYDKALDIYNRLLKIFKEFLDIDLDEIFLYCQLCRIYRELGKNEKGISAIKKAMKINPTSEIVKITLIDIYLTHELYFEFFNLLKDTLPEDLQKFLDDYLSSQL